MTVEELPDTALFRKMRVPLSDFIEFPVATKASGRGDAPVLPLEHPKIRFRSCSGFYLCNDFFEKFHCHLKPRPAEPNESHLFVWMVKKECSFSAAMHSFEGKNHPVPWWAIRPFLAYEANQDHRPLLSSFSESLFFMSAKGMDDQTFREPVSLSLNYGTLHTEWWLKLFVPGQGYKCREGQSFLSVL